MVSPSLSPWILAEAKPEPIPQFHSVEPSSGDLCIPFGRLTGASMVGLPMSYNSIDMMASASAMQHRPVIVATNKGDVTATFRIPGLITVPSDAQQHNVTISSFEFNAPLLWHTVPKANARVYMEVGSGHGIKLNK